MCPMCVATAAWIAASIATSGGLAAVVMKRTANLRNASNPQSITPSKEDHHG
jgi:hypothetical protein